MIAMIDEITLCQIEKLIKDRRNINEKDLLGKPLLHRATFDAAKLLIDNGTNIEAVDKNGYTALHFNQNVEVVKLLIKNGANVNAICHTGKTPLHVITDTEIMALLISNGADINKTDNNGDTALYKNINRSDVARLLIDSGADVNIVNLKGNTALHNCCVKYMVHYLIVNGANVNIKNRRGNTPLSVSNPGIKEILIENGAVPPNIRTYEEDRAFFSAKQQEIFDMYQSITSNDNDFFQMCLTYQNDINNNIKIDLKDMNIL